MAAAPLEQNANGTARAPGGGGGYVGGSHGHGGQARKDIAASDFNVWHWMESERERSDVALELRGPILLRRRVQRNRRPGAKTARGECRFQRFATRGPTRTARQFDSVKIPAPSTSLAASRRWKQANQVAAISVTAPSCARRSLTPVDETDARVDKPYS